MGEGYAITFRTVAHAERPADVTDKHQRCRGEGRGLETARRACKSRCWSRKVRGQSETNEMGRAKCVLKHQLDVRRAGFKAAARGGERRRL